LRCALCWWGRKPQIFHYSTEGVQLVSKWSSNTSHSLRDLGYDEQAISADGRSLDRGQSLSWPVTSTAHTSIEFFLEAIAQGLIEREMPHRGGPSLQAIGNALVPSSWRDASIDLPAFGPVPSFLSGGDTPLGEDLGDRAKIAREKGPAPLDHLPRVAPVFLTRQQCVGLIGTSNGTVACERPRQTAQSCRLGRERHRVVVRNGFLARSPAPETVMSSGSCYKLDRRRHPVVRQEPALGDLLEPGADLEPAPYRFSRECSIQRISHEDSYQPSFKRPWSVKRETCPACLRTGVPYGGFVPRAKAQASGKNSSPRRSWFPSGPAELPTRHSGALGKATSSMGSRVRPIGTLVEAHAPIHPLLHLPPQQGHENSTECKKRAP